jgi:biopolymer transport protein ExbD
MKRISYAVNRAGGGPRKPRKHNAKAPSLDISSLLDIMTILLVFLIKNVSMEVQKSSVPPHMGLPESFENEQVLADKAKVLLVRMYTDKVLYGMQSRVVGTPDDLINNPQVQASLVSELQRDYQSVINQDATANPAILLQADRNVDCQYITAFLSLASARAGYSNIFFSTVKAGKITEIFR